MAGSRSIIVWSIVVAICLVIASLAAARHAAPLLDRFFTIRVASLPVSPLEYDISNFRIGEYTMPLIGTDHQPFGLGVQTDSQNRLILFAGGKSLTMGPRTTPPDPSGRPDIKFTAEPGDELSFTVRRSFLSQPTPFEINFLGGSTPWWRRHVYYRLEWKKPSGAKLDMLWRFEQQYYAKKGWTAGYMMFDFRTGLIRAEILQDAIAHEDVVVKYISQAKGWKRTDYRIEDRGLSADGRSQVIAVINLEDERTASPGAGKSVVLNVDRASQQVSKELGGQ